MAAVHCLSKSAKHKALYVVLRHHVVWFPNHYHISQECLERPRRTVHAGSHRSSSTGLIGPKIISSSFFAFAFLVNPIVQSFRTLQRVPITGRKRLDYVSKWLGSYLETKEREFEDERQKENIHLGSESPMMQGPTLIFNTLLHASGLDDREWELRVFNAPGEQAIAYPHVNDCALTDAPRRQQNEKNRCLENLDIEY